MSLFWFGFGASPPSSITTSTPSVVTPVTVIGWQVEALAPPPVWAQLTSVVTAPDLGVDFHLVAREQYPMTAVDERYVAAYEQTTEGEP